jgi:hypothetical protein
MSKLSGRARLPAKGRNISRTHAYVQDASFFFHLFFLSYQSNKVVPDNNQILKRRRKT